MSIMSNKEEFIKKSNIIHVNIYDYSLVEYVGNKTKVKIICKDHGIFYQRPNCHLSGRRCPKCFGTTKKTLDEFILQANKAHNYKYDYSLVDYKGSNNKVKIICKEHGIFEKIAKEHIYLNGGCQKCKPNYRLDKESFIQKSEIFHKRRYDYSKVKFINSHTPVTIICKKHGEFLQKPYKHIQKRGCPSCKNSKGIVEICNILDSLNIKYEKELTIDGCISPKGNLLYFDIYIPEKNIYIEYDGEQHFRPVKSWGGEKSFNDIKERDSLKDKFCTENNIKLFRISYKENIKDKVELLLSREFSTLPLLF